MYRASLALLISMSTRSSTCRLPDLIGPVMRGASLAVSRIHSVRRFRASKRGLPIFKNSFCYATQFGLRDGRGGTKKRETLLNLLRSHDIMRRRVISVLDFGFVLIVSLYFSDARRFSFIRCVFSIRYAACATCWYNKLGKHIKSSPIIY